MFCFLAPKIVLTSVILIVFFFFFFFFFYLIINLYLFLVNLLSNLNQVCILMLIFNLIFLLSLARAVKHEDSFTSLRLYDHCHSDIKLLLSNAMETVLLLGLDPILFTTFFLKTRIHLREM